MELVFPTIQFKQDALDFRQEHFDVGEMTIHGSSRLHAAETYEEWLKKIRDDITRDDGTLVPATAYFGVQDGKIISTVQVRHRLNDNLFETGGHIGCSVRPSERGKGYSVKLLALALEKCRELAIESVLVTCDKDNIASAKAIMKNGGIFENEVAEGCGNIVQRYWISLQNIN